MLDFEQKLFFALLGIVVAIISTVLGALAGCFGFLWGEGRREFSGQLAGLRAMTLMNESICAAISSGSIKIIDLKIEWLTPHVEGLLRNEDLYKVLCNLLKLRGDIACFDPAKGHLLIDLETQAIKDREECAKLLATYRKKKQRILYFLPR